MGSLLRANTLRLKEHTDIVRQERDTARTLTEQLRLARCHALPDDVWRYDQMIRKVETLERYFDSMENQVDNMSLELARLSVEISLMLQDAGAQLKILQK